MFSLPTFIRRTPPDRLRAYFVDQHKIDPRIDWSGNEREVRIALSSFVQQLSQNQAELVYADFEQVHQLRDEVGQRALRSMVVDDLDGFDALDGSEDRGLSVLVRDPGAFKRALSVAYSERLYHGRSWSRYEVSKPGQPSHASDAMKAFEAELKDLFAELDGSGRRIMVESFERSGETNPCILYSIFVESLPESIIEFDDTGPQRTIRRPVIEAVVSYDQIAGTIDVVAKGSRNARDRIGDAFVHHLLGGEAELLPVSPRTFDLERLREPIVFETDPEDGIKDVRVTALRLRDLTDMAGRITVESTNAADGLHARADCWLGDTNPLRRDHWRIEHARLQIVFQPDRDGGRDKRITIELRRPNGSNLKEHIRRHELISSKYLARWGLVHAGQA